MTSLLLDAAYPPVNVADWIATLRMAGASGCMAYVYDLQIPGNRWTPDYCRAIQGAGFGLLPVYVWGPTYPAIGHVRDVMTAYGIASGPVMGDIEAGSTPSEAYFSGWCFGLRSHGYTPVVYGTASTLDTYRRYADKGYLASYVQRQLKPIPDLAGVSYDGWQYANSFQINGVEVDASVTTIPLIGGSDMTDAEHALLQETRDKVDQLWHDLVLDPTTGGDYNTGAVLKAVKAELDALKATPDPATPADPAVLAIVSRIEAALKQA